MREIIHWHYYQIVVIAIIIKNLYEPHGPYKFVMCIQEGSGRNSQIISVY